MSWTGLEGTVALVTGASRGIGEAILMALAQEGVTVVGTATTDHGVDSISEKLSNGYKGLGVKLDVKYQHSIDDAMMLIQDHFGNPTVLVNNAGITQDNLLLRMSEEQWLSVLETNLTAVYRLCKTCLRGMMKAKRGRIINISSVVGATGNPGQINYAATKSGLEGLTKSLAREVGSRSITVNNVAPGYIKTDMTEKLPTEQKELILNQIPLQRLGQPDDIAKAVCFLASDEASYITGQTIHVNGGMYMN